MPSISYSVHTLVLLFLLEVAFSNIENKVDEESHLSQGVVEDTPLVVMQWPVPLISLVEIPSGAR